jgi:hypothetical protein
MPMSVGSARISTQNLALQRNALQAVGCACISTEHASGAQRDRQCSQGARSQGSGAPGVLAETWTGREVARSAHRTCAGAWGMLDIMGPSAV